jgi:hypothetical protein
MCSSIIQSFFVQMTVMDIRFMQMVMDDFRVCMEVRMLSRL